MQLLYNKSNNLSILLTYYIDVVTHVVILTIDWQALSTLYYYYYYYCNESLLLLLYASTELVRANSRALTKYYNNYCSLFFIL